MAFTMKTAESKSGNETVNTSASPIEFLLEKKQLLQCALVETQFEKLITHLGGLRRETVKSPLQNRETFQDFFPFRGISLRLRKANSDGVGVTPQASTTIKQAFKNRGPPP